MTLQDFLNACEEHGMDIVASGLVPPADATEAGVPVTRRDAAEPDGVTTGGAYRCRLEGCCGWRLAVRWEDDTLTNPCTKGMERDERGWRIL